MISSACCAALYTGNANAGSSAASRIVFAFGRSGRLPRVFATTHPVHSTPTVAIYFQTVVSIVVALGLGLGFGPVVAFAVLGALITVFAIFIYRGACVATIRLYTTKRRYELKPIKHIIHPRDRHRDGCRPAVLSVRAMVRLPRELREHRGDSLPRRGASWCSPYPVQRKD
jgi:amino acid transporter